MSSCLVRLMYLEQFTHLCDLPVQFLTVVFGGQKILILVKSSSPSLKKCIVRISQILSETFLCVPRTSQRPPVFPPSPSRQACDHCRLIFLYGSGSQSLLPRPAAATPGNELEMQILKMLHGTSGIRNCRMGGRSLDLREPCGGF